MQKTVENQDLSCPQCLCQNLLRDQYNGEVVCGDCGLVIIEDMLDRGPEWRSFTLEDQQTKRRVGAPIKYSHFDKGLHTMIGGFKDATGRKLTNKEKRRVWRLRKWQNRSRVRDSNSRNLLQAMHVLQILSEKLHLSSSVQEFAAVIYRKALDKQLTRGRTIAGIAAGALYVACRFTKIPKTLNDITKVSSLSRAEISRNYRLLLKSLKIEMPTHDPLNYISRIAEKTNIPGEIQGIATKILRKAKKKRIAMGKDPVGLATAVLYIACQIKGNLTTQKELAQAAGITEVTLRNRKKELIKKLDLTRAAGKN